VCVCVCVCVYIALVIQHAMRMFCIVICGLSSLQYFSTFSHKRHDFRNKNLLSTKCVFWFSLQRLYEAFFILRRIKRGMIKNAYCSSCTIPVILVQLLWNVNFVDRLSANNQISNFMKICPVGPELFHAGGRTDRHDDANSRFSQFCEPV